MKSKQILILAAVFVVLVAVIVIVKMTGGETKTTIDTDSLVGEFETGQVGYIEFYHGEKPDRKVILAKKDGSWIVPSRHGALADVTRIEKLLGELRGLTGEIRTREASLFGEFKITDKEAVHLIFRDTAGSDIAYLLLGKAGPDWRSTFVRKNGSNNVHIVNVSLLSSLGVSRPDKGDLAGFEEDRWLDLAILPGADAGKITAVRLLSPHRELSFERVSQEDGEKKEEQEKAVWEVTTEGISFPANTGGINGVLRGFAGRRAHDIADPAKESEYGFGDARYVAEITFEDKQVKKILVGKEIEDEGEKRRFLKIEGAALLFIVDNYVVERLFEDANKLLDLKVPDLPEKDIEAITLSAPGRRTVLQHGEKGAWRVAEPELGFREQKDAAKKLAQQLLTFEPDDLWNLADTGGVRETEYSVIFDMVDGGTRRIEITGIIEGTEDKRYARVDGVDNIFVVSRHTVEKLFPGLSSLLNIKLAVLDREAVSAIEIERGAQKFTLRQNPSEEDKWLLDVYGYTFNTEKQKVQQIINYFTNIKPAEVMGKEILPEYGLEKPALSVTIRDARGAAKVVLGSKTETKYYAVEPDSGLVFTVVDKAFEAADVRLSQLAALRIFPPELEPDSIMISGSAGEFKANLNLKLREREKGGKKEKVWVTHEGRDVDRRLAAQLVSIVKSRLLATDVVADMKELLKTSALQFITLGDGKKSYTLTLWARKEKEKMRYCVLAGHEGYLLVRESMLEGIFKQAAKIAKSPKIKEPGKEKQGEQKEEPPEEKPKAPVDKGK